MLLQIINENHYKKFCHKLTQQGGLDKYSNDVILLSMNYLKKENVQSMWVHNSFVIFSDVHRMGLPVDIRCNIDINGQDVNLALKGYFSKVENNAVLYTIAEMAFIEKESSGNEKTCLFSFIYETTHPSGTNEKLNFSGRGTIVDIKRSANGRPEQLIMRLAPHLSTGKVRKEQRVFWKNEDTKMLWCIIIQEPYKTMQEFRDVIVTHCQTSKNNSNVELKDISASGVCLRVKSDSFTRRLFVNDYYMLFFSPMKPVDTSPFVMLGRRSRTDRKNDDGTSLVYLYFTHELDWNKSSLLLTWLDVKNSASERLRYFLLKNHTK